MGQVFVKKGVPLYHPQSNPSGFKIFVGDLPSTTNEGQCWERIRSSCDQVSAMLAYEKIVQVKVTHGRAHSGSSYVVITVTDYCATEVTQFKEKCDSQLEWD